MLTLLVALLKVAIYGILLLIVLAAAIFLVPKIWDSLKNGLQYLLSLSAEGTLLREDDRWFVYNEHLKVHEIIEGPKKVRLMYWQKQQCEFSIAPKGASILAEDVMTSENIPLVISLFVLYKVDPALWESKTPIWRLPKWNEGGWEGAVKRHAEKILRMSVTARSWRELNQKTVQEEIEAEIKEALNERMKSMVVSIVAVSIIKFELPPDMQESLVRAEQDVIESVGRVDAMDEYLKIFTGNAQAYRLIPYIIKWDLLNLLHKHRDLRFRLAAPEMLFSNRPGIPLLDQDEIITSPPAPTDEDRT